jgi:hypothetical protein
MDQVTTYTIKSRNSPNVWQFKYHLNGVLAEFKILEGTLTDVQVQWLRNQGHFPFYETDVKEWQTKLRKNFEITIGEPDLTFTALWELYGYKVKRFEAEKCFKKLKPADLIKAFLHIPKYKKRIAHQRIAQANLSTYINQRYFDDDE